MKVLARGKIREAPSPMTWVAGLLSLQQEGGWDHAVVIQQWNEQASKAERLVGGRFMTVKNILELEPSVRSVLQDAINQCGSPYSDDSLSTKKLVPGFVFRGARVTKQSNWWKYGQVTNESTTLALKYTNACYFRMPRNLRTRPTKTVLEARSEFCALAVALRDMAAGQVANIEPFLNKRWLSRLENGDVGLEVELTSAIASKEPSYGPRNCDSCLSGRKLLVFY
ncbi:unnamed protein product [Symbiodinium sp. KB8]|nr:unnamed protein product [Symbiodinium sp. KB8]